MSTQDYIQEGGRKLANTDHYKKVILTIQTDLTNISTTLLITPGD